MSNEEQTLHPARLAPMFDRTPSIPGTPVHSIQTVRRAAAKHDGPLTKILVANRGVSMHILPVLRLRHSQLMPVASPHRLSEMNGHLTSPLNHPRKLLFEYSELLMNLLCTPLLSIRMRTGWAHTGRRYVFRSFLTCPITQDASWAILQL